MASAIRTLQRQSLLHFLLLGGALFIASRALAPWFEAPVPIEVTAADIERLRNEWAANMQRMPTEPELQASLQHWLDEEILLREALRLRLDQTDTVARQRLLMNLRFVYPETPQDDEALLREARAMGMSMRDHVVRRRLIDLMGQRIASGVQIGETEIRDYVAQHPDRYATATRFELRQYFFSRDLRHKDAHIDALNCQQQLRARTDASCSADAFLLGSRLTGQTAESVTRMLGKQAAESVVHLQPHLWSAPIESIYGWHLLRIESVEPASEMEYAQVRRRASYALLAEKEKQTVSAALHELRKRYVIRLPDNTGASLQ